MKSFLFIFMLISVLITGLSGCGVKGDPVPYISVHPESNDKPDTTSKKQEPR